MKNFILSLACALGLANFAGAQQVSLSTNLAGYLNDATLSLDASMGVARHWSVVSDVVYNPYSELSKRRDFALGARYWTWHVFSGWWLDSRLKYQEFNAREDGSRREGDRYGGSLSAGYSYLLGKHFNLELGFGLWSGYEAYSVFECETCGRLKATGGKAFIRPDDIIFALSYVF